MVPRRARARSSRPEATTAAGWAAPRERFQVEAVSANPTGPITVAAARNGAYGDSVARLLSFAGHDVEREYYYNDSGAQMDRFRESVDAVRRGEEPPEDGYRGDYVHELAATDGDPVPKMLEQIEASLERFRIHFDSWARQSALESGCPRSSRSSTRTRRTARSGLARPRTATRRTACSLRSDGRAPTYRAADVVYLVDKLERGFDHALYVLGADHHGTRNWYAAVARMLGYDPERVEVLLYQLVHLTRGGEQTKMSKRRGDVVFLDEFVDEVGVDAARWYLVSRGHDQTIEIDVDLAREKSEKNPVYYVQYAHARIAGILRNVEGAEPTRRPAGRARAGGARPRQAARRVSRRRRRGDGAPRAARAAELRDPRRRRLPPLLPPSPRDRRAAAQPFRLGLVVATKAVIARSLDLIGVEAPDRM